MTPSPRDAQMPATPTTAPATAAEVMAALQRLHRKTDALLTLINSKPQP